MGTVSRFEALSAPISGSETINGVDFRETCSFVAHQVDPLRLSDVFGVSGSVCDVFFCVMEARKQVNFYLRSVLIDLTHIKT